MEPHTFILTHPLTGNYGGLLQAYASYMILNTLGYNSYLYHYIPKDLPVASFSYLRYYGSCLKALLTPQKGFNPIWRKLYIAKQFTRQLRTHHQAGVTSNSEAVRYYVGSDQVWRATYCRKMKSVAYYFLDFATSEQRRNSIAYSASFGSDEWEGSPEETERCRQLLKDFKAVSVREHSGVNICKDTFDASAVQMPDPTLLLEPQEYNRIIKGTTTWQPQQPWLSVYVLDTSPQIAQLLQNCERQLNTPLQHLLPHTGATKLRDRIALSVPQWLRLIRDGEYLITDSFHGCVFAIIFNKPFICLGNESRGSARFDSLLSTFDLQDRLITNQDADTIVQTLTSPIDWDRVNAIRRSEQKRAFEFLRKNLE